jgi:hypothetical protein
MWKMSFVRGLISHQVVPTLFVALVVAIPFGLNIVDLLWWLRK